MSALAIVDDAMTAPFIGPPALSATISTTISCVGDASLRSVMSTPRMSFGLASWIICAIISLFGDRQTLLSPDVPESPKSAAAAVTGAVSTGSPAMSVCPAVRLYVAAIVENERLAAPSVMMLCPAVPSADGGVYVTPRKRRVDVADRKSTRLNSSHSQIS